MTPHHTKTFYQKKESEKLAHNGIRRKMATIIFEAGVIFHSLVVGLDPGVSTGSEFTTLLTALCFHQFFEGVAVGNSALGSIEAPSRLLLVNFLFSITTPLAKHLASRFTARGILLYTGLVELLTYNMTTNQKFLARSTSQRLTLYTCLWLSAGLMALIRRWA
ncbi:high-affinity Zn(2+) transporter zrt1 [Phytophthora pseudosyringae]|uniref:High-affinity Zn(2+) transporter zrt1 n=1 Tax=Phytophthora pseudosyringae TaxID=221518 RepID=A0A8T1W5J5_9STRA|nr:high-affinity Zn(2+) transporter zrt1 [Phytophthora pseudosyringae]